MFPDSLYSQLFNVLFNSLIPDRICQVPTGTDSLESMQHILNANFDLLGQVVRLHVT